MTDNAPWERVNRIILLVLLALAVFLSLASILIIGPLIVALAKTYGVSVSVTGQLAGAPAITWAVTAPLVGPFSDTYGQRVPLLLGLLLMVIGLIGAVFTWNFESMLVLRLVTGLGAAMVPPNCMAIISDTFPAARRGKAIGWLFTASGAAAALGMPVYAYLLGVAGWHLPFYATGFVAMAVLLLCLVWLPRREKAETRHSFISHYRIAGANPNVWYLLSANALQRVLFFGMFAYLTAYFFEVYRLAPKDITLLLAVAGSGGILGGFLGGRVADNAHRLTFLALSCLGAGLLAMLTFAEVDNIWTVALLACGTTTLTSISLPVTPTLVMELSGNSRTTAAGLFAVSNQVGTFIGPSIGGLILAVGGFFGIGLFFLVVSVLAALLIWFKVREHPQKLGAQQVGPC